MLPYKSPECCSRCGSPNVAFTWRANQQGSQFNLLAFLTIWFDLHISRFIPNTFDVPVCSPCGIQLERIHKMTKTITISLAAVLGLLLGLVFVVKGLGADNLLIGFILMLWVTLFGAILGAVGGIVLGLIIQEGLNYEFCSFDGQYYRFKNKKFRREFTALNPTLVKQKMK